MNKTEKNRRKKENAKKKRAEASQKATEENRLLEQSTAETTTNRDDNNNDKLLYEIKASKGKGQGIFATKFIKEGTQLFQEFPLLWGGPEWIEKHLSFGVLSQERQDKMMALYKQCHCKKMPCTETELMKVFNVNGYEANPMRKLGEKRQSVVYEISSRFNHSCIPNVSRKLIVNEMRFIAFARNDIRKGEELTMDYIGACREVKWRRDRLRFIYGFHCTCAACISGVELPADNGHLSREVANNFKEGFADNVINHLNDKEIEALLAVEEWNKKYQAQVREMRDTVTRDLDVYCYTNSSTHAVREKICTEFINAQKELLAENPFGMTAERINEVFNGELKKAIDWAERRHGQAMQMAMDIVPGALLSSYIDRMGRLRI